MTDKRLDQTTLKVGATGDVDGLGGLDMNSNPLSNVAASTAGTDGVQKNEADSTYGTIASVTSAQGDATQALSDAADAQSTADAAIPKVSSPVLGDIAIVQGDGSVEGGNAKYSSDDNEIYNLSTSAPASGDSTLLSKGQADALYAGGSEANFIELFSSSFLANQFAANQGGSPNAPYEFDLVFGTSSAINANIELTQSAQTNLDNTGVNLFTVQNGGDGRFKFDLIGTLYCNSNDASSFGIDMYKNGLFYRTWGWRLNNSVQNGTPWETSIDLDLVDTDTVYFVAVIRDGDINTNLRGFIYLPEETGGDHSTTAREIASLQVIVSRKESS